MTAKTGPRGRHDGPRGRQDGPKMAPKNGSPPSCFGIGRQELSKTPLDPSKIDYLSFVCDFLVDFRFLFGRCLVDFCLIFDSLFDRFLERILLLFSLFFSFSLSLHKPPPPFFSTQGGLSNAGVGEEGILDFGS